MNLHTYLQRDCVPLSNRLFKIGPLLKSIFLAQNGIGKLDLFNI